MCEDFAELEDEDVGTDDYDTHLSDIPRRIRYYPASPEPSIQTRLEEFRLSKLYKKFFEEITRLMNPAVGKDGMPRPRMLFLRMGTVYYWVNPRHTSTVLSPYGVELFGNYAYSQSTPTIVFTCKVAAPTEEKMVLKYGAIRDFMLGTPALVNIFGMPFMLTHMDMGLLSERGPNGIPYSLDLEFTFNPTSSYANHTTRRRRATENRRRFLHHVSTLRIL